MNIDAIIVKSEDMLDANVGDSTVLMSITTGTYIELNQFGFAIWKALNACPTCADVVETIMRQFEVDKSVCTVDVIEFVSSLRDEGLVTIG